MNNETKNLILTITKAITLAMGVAVVALSAMHMLSIETAITLLGIGLCTTGLSLLNS